MNNDPYQLIKATEQLPSPKGVALKILQLVEEEDTTVEDLARVIESDPALSSKLLKIVNSPMAGARKKVGSLTRATVMLGFRTVSSLALGLSLLSDNRPSGCAAFDYDQFWSRSLAQAVAASKLAKELQWLSPDEAFTCALLGQIGRLAFASAYPDRYAEILRVAEDNANDLRQLEQEVFGLDHPTLTAEMMSEWHLPTLFILAVRHQDAPPQDPVAVGRLSKLLSLSQSIAGMLTSPTTDPETLSAVTQEAFQLGLHPGRLNESYDAIAEHWREAGRIFSIPTQNAPSMDDLYCRAANRRRELAIASDSFR